MRGGVARPVIGLTFGLWTVVAESPRGRPHVVARCACGITKETNLGNLRCGGSKSCGCQASAAIAASKTTHGGSRRPEYFIWKTMRQRCTNPASADFAEYGGRGIRVAPRWDDFEAFFADVGPRPSSKHSLDRVENDGHYEPGNVRWATAIEQANNRRPRRRAA